MIDSGYRDKMELFQVPSAVVLKVVVEVQISFFCKDNEGREQSGEWKTGIKCVISNGINLSKDNETYYPNNGRYEFRRNADDKNGEEKMFSIQIFKKTLLNKHLPYGWRFHFDTSWNKKQL